MGFPDNWTEGFSDNVRYLMTGNAAAVSVAESIAESIKDIFLKEG
jgi:site-specific DNA-cytosine methylase